VSNTEAMEYTLTGILFLVLAIELQGQQSQQLSGIALDTFLLRDVTVSYTIPLNNAQIDKFYRTNYSSTIDNLTGHLDGVSLIRRGAYAMEPQMNGFSGGQMNITIDGMKMFGACTDKMDPVTSYLEPVNLESITLEHGTNGCIHGNNIGGSIEMSLQGPHCCDMHNFSSSVSLGYESVSNGRNLLISTGYQKNKWAWGLNGVYRKHNMYRAGNGDIIDYSQFEKVNVHSVLEYATDSFSNVRADFLYDLAVNVGYPALPMDVSRASAAIFALEYQRDKLQNNLKAKIYYNSVYHLMDDSQRDSLFFLSDENNLIKDSVIMRMDMPGWSSTAGAYVQDIIKLNSKNTLIIKLDNYLNFSLAEMTMHMHFTGSPAEPPMYLQTWPDMMRSVTGLYIGNTIRFNSKLQMGVNGRLDYNVDILQSSVAKEQFSVFNYDLSRKYGRITKGINLTGQYKIMKPVILSMHTGYAERIPTISEFFGFYLYNAYDGYDYIGNPSLSTEKSVSVRFALTYFKHGLKINLSQSLNFLSDYIIGVTDTVVPPMNFYTNGLRIFNNIPSAKLYSTDLQAMYRPLTGLTFFLLSKFTWGELVTNAPIPLIPPLKNTISVSYEMKKWLFQTDYENALGQKRVNIDYGERETPPYNLFNIKASRHFSLKETVLDVSLGITNIFDSNYYEHLDWGHIPRPGRSFNLFIKYSY